MKANQFILVLLLALAGCGAPAEIPADGEGPGGMGPAGQEKAAAQIGAELCAQAEKGNFRTLCNAVVAQDMGMCEGIGNLDYRQECTELAALASGDPHNCFNTSNPFTCIGDYVSRTGNISICDEIDAGGCYLWKAKETRNVSLCFRVQEEKKSRFTLPLCHALVYRDASKCEEAGYGNATCYYRYALMMQDGAACEHAGMHRADCISLAGGNWSACAHSGTGAEYCYEHYLREHYDEEACREAGFANCGELEAISERDPSLCGDDTCRRRVMQAILRGYAATWYYQRQ